MTDITPPRPSTYEGVDVTREHTVCTPGDLLEFTDRLLAFVSGERSSLDDVFDDLRIEIAAEDGTHSTWRIEGVVRGTYRVMPIGAPASTRHMALAGELVMDFEDTDGAHAHARLRTGRGHLRMDTDNLDVVLGMLPLSGAAAAMTRALFDAEIQIQVYGPSGRMGILDRNRHNLIPVAEIADMAEAGHRGTSTAD
jgi:hypothetical protein